MKVKLLSLIGVASLLISCTYEVYEADSNELSRITCAADNFIYEDAVQTRSAVDVNSLAFQWSKNDVVGIFPNKGTQISFPMTDGAGTSSATFDGGGWALRNGAEYYAYYPYNWEYCESEDFKNKIPYTYIGQKAVYENQDGVVQLGAYDYMYTSASTPESGAVNFAFHHIGALARMEITFPTTAIYTKLVINASEAIFPVTGTFDLAAETFALSSSELVSSIEIDLENQAGTENEKNVVYFMLPPADCRELELFRAILIDNNNNESTVEIEKTNIESGKAYSWTLAKLDNKFVYDLDVTLTEAGELNSLINMENLQVYKRVKISGYINEYDIAVISDMDNLIYLDLTDVINETLPNGAFANTRIASILLPKQLCRIPDNCFNSSKITSINIPNSVLSIGDKAFYKCEELSGNLILPDDLQTIGKYAFYCCYKINGSLRIPDSTISIGDYAFAGQDQSMGFEGELILGGNLKSLGKWAFAFCRGFTNELIIPQSITCLNETPLDLNNIDMGGDNGTIFFNCGFTNVILHEELEYIGSCVFQNCHNLKGPINFPSSLKAIGKQAFYGCNSLEGNIVIPDNVTYLGAQCFGECINLADNIVIGKNVTYIGNFVFRNCSNVKKVYCKSMKPAALSLTENDYIPYFGNYKYLGIPSGSKEAYLSADVWKDFMIIEEVDFESLPF